MKSLLIVDDDKTFCDVLAKNMAKRGFEVKLAHSVSEAEAIAEDYNPEWVLADLKMPETTGLELIPKLLKIDPETQIVVLTGYANVATAVEAIKLGALHYLSKPVSVDDIIAAFSRKDGNPNLSVDGEPATLTNIEWEHILKTLERNQQNISATARELGMHRRTLQRKLDKMPKAFKNS